MGNVEPVIPLERRWFGGDRTVEEQMIGLEKMLAECEGASVLDVGCAEGDIGFACTAAGALFALGVDNIEDHIRIAKERAGWPAKNHFEVQDANTYAPPEKFDIVLLLAILHKLQDPTAAVIRFSDVCLDLLVIRWPVRGPDTIIDPRSGMKKFKITRVLKGRGFVKESEVPGPRGEIVSYYRRIKC